MRIGICSDIHVHRGDQHDDVEALIQHVNQQRDLDLLVCAGDLSHHSLQVRTFLASITLQCPRAWLPGNHDVWVIDPETEGDTPDHRYRVTLPALSEAVGWHYLPSGPLLVGGLTVVGTTGWFTGAGFSEWFDGDADDRDEALAARFAADLEQAISDAPAASRLIVVTHHVPYPACLPRPNADRGDHSARIAEVIARHTERIELVIHGHKHRRYGPTRIEGVTYIAHPFGYPGQHGGPGDGLRVLDLGM